MEFIVGILFAVKSLVFMGGFIAPDKTHVHISGVRITVSGKDLRASCRVANAFSGDIKKLARTGTVIRLYLFLDLRQADTDSSLCKVSVEKSIVYDMLKKEYHIQNGFSDTAATTTSMDSALVLSERFEDVMIAPAGAISKEKKYYLTLHAVLGKTRVEALGNSSIDLMYYWNYKRPSARTDFFEGAAIIASRGYE